MTTTRAILLATAGLTVLAATTFAILQLRLPIASIFEYGTGTLVTTGLVTMMIGVEGIPRRRPHRTATTRPESARRRAAPLSRALPHGV